MYLYNGLKSDSLMDCITHILVFYIFFFLIIWGEEGAANVDKILIRINFWVSKGTPKSANSENTHTQGGVAKKKRTRYWEKTE